VSEHQATIEWHGHGCAFTDNRYSREHRWIFDGGSQVIASSSPEVVPLPWSVAEAVDPEEAFVASLASCHMLWFLSIAAKRGYRIESYRDQAVGVLGKNEEGRLAITQVILRPQVRFAADKVPDAAGLQDLHATAHDSCFLASSVKTRLRCEPVSIGSGDSDTKPGTPT
jgi:organic hydroperoxide reductase OsmC/OhrA